MATRYVYNSNKQHATQAQHQIKAHTLSILRAVGLCTGVATSDMTDTLLT